MNPAARKQRKDDLAKIHIAKDELNLGDATYRHIIEGIMSELGIPGKPSAANLNAQAREKLLDTFRDMGWSPVESAEASGPDHDRGEPHGRYQSTGRDGFATQDQLNYIAVMEDQLGWTPNPDRLEGFIERQLGKEIEPRFLRNRQASDVITGLQNTLTS
jgi:hypothetical protein